MTTEITAFNLDPNDSSTCDFQIQLPRKCPICSTAHASSPVCSGYLHRRYGNAKLYSMFFCPSCESAFFVSYRVTDDYSNYSKTCGTIIAQYPNPSTTTPFSEEISILSPKFVEIYHQSEIAESTNLTEICGIGYRKALEFLVKDFAIHEHPEDKEIIEKKLLSQCIKNYIDDDRIKTLAERSAWIGNDEAHYVRKQEDRDVSDLKNFIKAIVYFIGMILVTEDAASITSKQLLCHS